ncbi:CDP-glycerol glycerophosphotransferase family protein [Microbacterium memoriense]|uniref:CDP-glycerol glycerophosphotransferase family protein n=1 Tax=Microbacterium memoriense TaxID=2978350 RepID=A0ABT2PA07_9MICO|nr:CDP-glycerol glycerophosphotransferase family protein [Microbacterium memoriense]MCT9001440.1 CDP-glycerol glycerophosphotransferase family protein [Microbacterium memoriense]
MASFSFGAGNAGKLLRIPLYAVGRIVTAVVPRSRDLWVFGCAVGLTDGAWALWHHAAAAGERAVWLTGTAADAQEALRHGIPHAPKMSLRGFWLTTRARVIVVTHGFGDVNRYAATGGIIVQLWHGIPLKRIGLDSPVTTESPVPILGGVLRGFYRRTQARIRLLPAASELVRGRLESAFGLPDDRVPVTGEPRVDVLSRGSGAERRDAARLTLATLVGPADPGVRRVLYAPTWRDGAPDPAIPTADQWRKLVELLHDTDTILLVRSHPLGAGDYESPGGSDRVHALGSDIVPDITPLLAGMDVLVTDYSSLAFDASLVPLPTVFFAPDLAEYAARRGFYGTYEDVAGTDPARDWESVIAHLRRILTDEQHRTEESQRAARLSSRVHAFADGRNTDRVYARIRAAMERES